MMEVVVTTAAISRAKLQSNHHQQTNIQLFLQAGCPSCHPTNIVEALKGKYHIPWTCLPKAHPGVFQLCLWPPVAPGYLGEGCHASHQPSDASTTCLNSIVQKCIWGTLFEKQCICELILALLCKFLWTADVIWSWCM